MLPRILSRFATTHPQVEVDVQLSASLKLVRRLEAGELNLAVAPLPVSLVSEDYEVLGPKQGLSKIGDYQLRLDESKSLGSAGRAFSEHVFSSFRDVAGDPKFVA